MGSHRLLTSLILFGMLSSVAAALNGCAPAVHQLDPLVPAVSGPFGPARVMSFAEFAAAEARDELGARSDAPEGASTIADAGAAAACDAHCLKLRQEFRYVVYAGKQVYAYWSEKNAQTGRDFDAWSKVLEAEISSATSQTEYYVLLNRWAAAFEDGHVYVEYKRDRSDLEIYSAPVRLQVIAPATDHEKVVVTSVKDSAVSKINLKRGDEIIAVGDKPIADVLTEAASRVSGSTARMRRSDAAHLLVDALGAAQAGQPLKLKARRAGKADFEATLPRVAELSPPGARKPAPDPTGEGLISATIVPAGDSALGYLRIDEFAGTDDEALLAAAMSRLARTQGLLIDVRLNGGGDRSGDVVLSRLASAVITRFRTSARVSDLLLADRPRMFSLFEKAGLAGFTEWADERVEPAAAELQYVGKPVVLLTGVDCFSSCDTFASALQANHLATVVGEATGGGTGQPLVFELPYSKNLFAYSTVRGQTADGKGIEGVGTQPDVLIERTQAELREGKDQQLMAALALLGKKVADVTAPVKPATPPPGGVTMPEPEIADTQSLDVSPTRAANEALRLRR